MKRLAKAAALPCLQNRIGSESNAAAKNQMQQTIDALNAANGGGEGGAPANVAAAKYYVALSRITNNSGRPQSDVDAIVLPAIKGKLSASDLSARSRRREPHGRPRGDGAAQPEGVLPLNSAG